MKLQQVTWDEAAKFQIQRVFSYSDILSSSGLGAIRAWVDRAIDITFKQGKPVSDETVWLDIGATSVLAHRGLTQEHMLDVLVGKMNDYGPNNILLFGDVGLAIRLHDKVARLENLTSRGNTPAYESIDDTFLDIVGYSVIGLMLYHGQFELPLEGSTIAQTVH